MVIHDIQNEYVRWVVILYLYLGSTSLLPGWIEKK